MRNMSFSLTTQQFRDGTKDVTRRLGWVFLKPGDLFQAVVKAMGLKKGEHVEPLGVCQVVSTRRERVDSIMYDDCVREGFRHLSPYQFVGMFCKHMGCKPNRVITRIVFTRIDKPGAET